MSYEDRELEEIKKRRYMEYLAVQRMAQQQAAEELKRQAEIQRLKAAILWKYVDEDVRSRLANIRLADPQFAETIENYIITLLQSGRVKRVNFEIFKKIVTTLKSR